MPASSFRSWIPFNGFGLVDTNLKLTLSRAEYEGTGVTDDMLKEKFATAYVPDVTLDQCKQLCWSGSGIITQSRYVS